MGGIVIIAGLCLGYLASRVTAQRFTVTGVALVFATVGFGVVGFLDKRLTAEELADALERIHQGETGVASSNYPPSVDIDLGDWPGRGRGLSAREAEAVALITQGLSNEEIADRMYMSINTVKTYIRTAYRKIGVDSRTQAVLWGVRHGFTPDHRRVDHWRGGP